jgi:hypothetical protein
MTVRRISDELLRMVVKNRGEIGELHNLHNGITDKVAVLVQTHRFDVGRVGDDHSHLVAREFVPALVLMKEQPHENLLRILEIDEAHMRENPRVDTLSHRFVPETQTRHATNNKQGKLELALERTTCLCAFWIRR